MDIKSVIKRYGETVYSIANKMGISQPSVSQIINGNPTAKRLEALARAIGCSPAEFFDDWQSPDAVTADAFPPDGDVGVLAENEQQSAPGLVGLLRCPGCGRGIRLYAEPREGA